MSLQLRLSNSTFHRATFAPQKTSRVSIRSRAQQALGIPAELKAEIDSVITRSKVVAFIKGTKQFPQCGFSNTVVQVLRSCNVPFETVNVLEDERMRSGMKVYSQWPTFPQVYIDGEFVGGCDILIEMYQSGELKEILDRAMLS